MNLLAKNKKIIIGILVVAVIAYVAFSGIIDINEIVAYIKGIGEHPLAPIIFIGFYTFGVVFALPGLPLTLLAGTIFGVWYGTLYVVIAANLGCQITFFISRYIGKDFVERFIKADSFIAKISKQVEKNGMLIMLYLRLIPLFPFNLINYAMGLTPVSYKDYTLANLFGMLPGTFLYVYLSAAALDIKDNPLGIIVPIVLLVLFTVVISYVKKKKQIVEE